MSTGHRILGKNHPKTLHSTDHLAAALRELGQHEQARQLAKDTLTRMRRTLGNDHPETLRRAANLATVLTDLGEHEQARLRQE
jgi:acetyl-CoA carboxylase alpha subunit